MFASFSIPVILQQSLIVLQFFGTYGQYVCVSSIPELKIIVNYQCLYLFRANEWILLSHM